MTTIEYSIARADSVRLTVVDVSGRQIASLVKKSQAPGHYQVQFDAQNLTIGVYLYRLLTDAGIVTRKMMVVR